MFSVHSKKKNLETFVVSRFFCGGDKRDRTADLLNAIQALSRLVRLHTPLNRVKRALQYAGHLNKNTLKAIKIFFIIVKESPYIKENNFSALRPSTA